MIYVMSDIHGQKRRFDSVMKQINLQPDDTLYILGDVIDRNPDGIKILRQIMAMPNAKMLLGNHELMMMNALYYPPPEDEEWPDLYYGPKLSLWYRNGGEITHNYLKHIKKTVRQEIFEYLEKLPLNIELTLNNRQSIPTQLFTSHIVIGLSYWKRIVGVCPKMTVQSSRTGKLSNRIQTAKSRSHSYLWP